MTAADLKASILDRAVHGLLVPQNPNDEPAAKPSPIDNPPYELPKGWVWVRLGNVCSVIMGQSPDSKSIVAVDGTEFHQGKVLFTDYIIGTSKELTNTPTKIAPRNSALLCVRAPVGKVNITDREICIGRGLCAIIPPQGMSIRFLFFWLQTLESSFNLKATGSTFKAISKNIINDELIPLPPLAEQKRIVAKIEELMPLVEEYGKAETELAALNDNFPTALRKSILQHAVEGRLTAAWRKANPRGETAAELLAKITAEKKHLLASGKIKKQKSLPPITDDERPFPIPDSWEWVRLDDISYNVGTKENQIPAKAIQPQGRIPVVSQGQKLIDGYCDVPDKQITDIPLVMFGDHTRNVKFIDFKFVIGADGTKFFKPLTDAKWLYYWTLFTSTQIGPRGYGRHWGLLNEQSIPLPPLAEQKAIVERVEELLGLVEKMK